MPPKTGTKPRSSVQDPSLCRHGGPRATSHILECINMMVNHNEFGITDEEFEEHGNDDAAVQELLLEKMKRFITRHPEAAGDDSIKTLTALAVDELLLNGNLENARVLHQPVPFLKFFKEHGVAGIESRRADLQAAAAEVSSAETEEGMLKALTAEVGSKCKCLTLSTTANPLNPQPEEPEALSYEESLAALFRNIPVKKLNAMGQDSRLHIEIRRLPPPNDKPPYLCIIIAPASRYVFHSFPIEETNSDKAFMHVLEGLVTAVVTEGMGMIEEEERIRPANITTPDPLLVKFLSPLLEGTRVTKAVTSDKVTNADPDAKVKESPLIAIMDGVYADFNIDLTKPNSKRKLPIGDNMSEEAKWKIKSRTASGNAKYIVDPENEKRAIPEKMFACKFCKTLAKATQCHYCRDAWYCSAPCQTADWDADHQVECSRMYGGKTKKKGGAQYSDESGDDLDAQAARDALDSFAIDLHRGLPSGGSKKKTAGKKKGKGKGKGKKK